MCLPPIKESIRKYTSVNNVCINSVILLFPDLIQIGSFYFSCCGDHRERNTRHRKKVRNPNSIGNVFNSFEGTRPIKPSPHEKILIPENLTPFRKYSIFPCT